MPEKSLAERVLSPYDADLTVRFPIGADGDGFVMADLPVYVVMEKVVKITDKDGNQVRFRLNYEQCEVYREICRQRRAGKPVRIDILKARQMGMSTFIAALFSILCFFGTNVSVGIIADTLGHAQGLFEKYQYIYDHLDDDNPYRDERGEVVTQYSYKPRLKWNKGQKLLATAGGNSKIEVMAVGDAAGRSMNFQYLHLSECAFWDNLEKTLTSVLQTVSRKNLNSMVFFETTANGFNAYKDRWDRDYSGGKWSPYKALFLPWFHHPDYVDKVPMGFDFSKELEEWELEKMETYHLSREKMFWYHSQYLDVQTKGGGKYTMLQEYPFSPVDAFVSSGRSVFDREALAERKEEIVRAGPCYREGQFTCRAEWSQDGQRIDLKDLTFREVRNGPLRIYREPVKGMPYVVTVDPNMGGSDNAAIQVFCNYDGKQCAVFCANDFQPDEVAEQAIGLGYMYNTALVSSEMNVGQSVMTFMLKAAYPHLYFTQQQEYENALMTTRLVYGHKTTKSNRQFMIDEAKMAFRQDKDIICDYDTLCEMENFQVVERYSSDGSISSSKQEASGGAHDDRVMAWAAFYLVRGQQTAVPSVEYRKSEESLSFDQLEQRYMESRARSERQNRMKMGGFGIKW